MKKLLTLIAFIFCLSSAKAQYLSVKVTNASGISDLYVRFHGSDNPSTPCSRISDVNPTGPLLPFTSQVYTLTSVTWVPALSMINFNAMGFDIIPSLGPSINGVWLGFCPTPPSPFPYGFSNGTFRPVTVTVVGTQIEISI